MELYEAIKGRRSIRRFKPDPVPKEVLDRILEMAIWAPSGMNLQNWYFLVVTGERKDALVGLASKSYDYIEPVLKEVFAERPPVVEAAKKFFSRLGGAPVLVFAFYEPTRERPETSVQTVAAAIQNLLLAAHAEGLGTCWMTGPCMWLTRLMNFWVSATRRAWQSSLWGIQMSHPLPRNASRGGWCTKGSKARGVSRELW